jgi:glycosyltransferase involved in cell wall biosynthesis
MGWQDHLLDLLPGFDLFILPSRYEGQPLSLLEALSVGLPCIASAVAGIPDILGEGRYGSLVPAEDPAALADAIAAFARAPQHLYEKAGRAGAHLAAHHHPVKNMARVVRLWEQALIDPGSEIA